MILRWALRMLPFLSLCAAACAMAGPPFITDDPEPVDLHHWEVYIASQYFNYHSPLGAFGTAPHFEVNYGAAPNLQLHMIAPFAWSTGAAGGTTYGYGDTELGVKYRFVQETKTRPQIGTFPLVEAPTGDASRSLGTGSVDWYLPIWIQKSWGAWTTYGGGGYWHNSGAGGRDFWYVGWQIQKQVSKQLALGVELFHTTAPAFEVSERTAFNVGAMYDFDEGHHLLASAGADFHGPNGAMGYLAYQWTFGPHEKRAEGGEK